jgi:linoleoyl-CoA desaturase
MKFNNNIKFSPQIKPEFIKELREKVADYFEKNKIQQKGNVNMIVKSVIMLALYFVPYFLMLFGVVNSLSGVLFCWIIMGIGMAGVGMALMHDANHGSYSRNPRVNKILENSLYLLGGYPPNWQYQHNTLHHGFTNIDGLDEDIDPGNIMRFSPHKPIYKIHQLQQWYAWFFYGLMTLAWVTIKDFERLSKYKHFGARLNSKREYGDIVFIIVISKIIYYLIFLVIPIIMISIAWYWIVLFFLIMHFLSGLILGIIFQTAHVVTTSKYPLPDEEGKIENNWAIHQLMTTSDFSPKSKIFSWLIGGLNYQIEHHLFPQICHVHYQNISHLVRDTAIKYDLPYHVQPNFFKAVFNHFKMLKMLGRQGKQLEFEI